ncbi:MAG: hypothetical protein I3273_05090 [Candidatus Moeniiplasma glomeromycotorum]|nr:hypothetical protein [Candidatus Moeniiplasma glomeromycotorum]MCE8169273.1 hypothetical protein [Candidatus Moeniiplasma glomeromycotorum]MCE8169468.1 hypothetical protein [Candidatus Moeniiplasma glomeromycotorum]
MSKPTKKELEQAYRECYENNPQLLELSAKWEQAQNEDWINWERNKN